MSRTLPLRYALPNVLLVLTIAGLIGGGYWIWLALGLLVAVGGPIDEAVGDDRALLGPAARVFFTASLYATLPLVIVMTVVALHYFTAGDPIGLKAWLAATGIAFTDGRTLTGLTPTIAVGLAAAAFYALSAAVVGHELVHWTDNKLAMAIGRALFGFTLSPAFSIAHVYGHHRTVGTLADHATPHRGENLLAFAWRASVEENAQALAIEAKFLARKGFATWSWRNRVGRGFLYPLAIVIGAWWLAGPAGAAAFLVTGTLGKFLHRAIDYTQHYGLVRVEGTPIEARHSWDCYRRLSSALLYNIPRHADHHMYGGHRAWELTPVDGAPMMPYGYNTMLVIALIPPVFRRMIDPLLAEWDRTMASEGERALIRAHGWDIVPATVGAGVAP